VRASALLIAQKFLQIVTSGLFPRIGAFALPFAPGKIEVFAEVGHVLFRDRIGAAVFALVRHARFVADAIEADLEVGAAAMAAFGTARQTGNGVFPAAVMTMTSQWHGSHNIDTGAEIKSLQIANNQNPVTRGTFN